MPGALCGTSPLLLARRLLLFRLPILYSARRQTASNINPSGPSQNTA
jgi:hypothetical protein